MLKVTIVGRGAIGSLVTARSIENGTPFNMWWRSAAAESLQVRMKNGAVIDIFAGESGSPDLLILPLKAWQITPTLREFQDHIPTHCCIALLHNGLGTETATLAQFPDNPVLRLSTSRAAKKSNNQIAETGYGQSHGGWLREPPAQIKASIERLLGDVLTPCQWHQDIYPALWQKLAINCVINPLTARHNIRNGALAKAEYRQHISRLLEEFCLVSEACGYHFSHPQLEQAVHEVIDLTADNYSSMHQDILYRRPTEIDFINGFLLQEAALHGFTLRHHQSLYAEIRKLESETAINRVDTP